MEQLIVFLLFVVGSIISSVIQHKKKKAEEQQQRELEELTSRPRSQGMPPAKPQTSWPQTAGDWQEQLRRMLEGESAPPVIKPVIKPVLLPPQPKSQQKSQPKPQQTQSSKAHTPPPVQAEISERKSDTQRSFKLTEKHYERASNLHANVQERMRSIREQTSTHTAAPAPSAFNRARPPRQSNVVRRLRRSRAAVREAFIASLIFAPPKAVESGEVESAR